MKRHLIATVSGIALLFGAAGAATAAGDKTMQDKTVQPGATQTQSEMNKSPSMKDRATSMDKRSSSAAASDMRSYEDNKDLFAGATGPGGMSADKLIGADVVNASGEEIGEIEDLVIGPDNKITKAIVEVGGFLGIGSKFVAVDVDQLQANSKGDGYMSALTKAQLKTNAEYKKEDGHWLHSYR
jgi:sporulation protein YlmC with PRC-barrel domain